jgi:hypothetical protein
MKKLIITSLIFLYICANISTYAQGGSLKFDGLNDRLLIPKNGNTDLLFKSGTNFTIEFWSKSYSTTNLSSRTIVDDTTNSYKWNISTITGKTRVQLRKNDGVLWSVIGKNTVADSNWHHTAIVLSRTKDSLYIYTDGRLDSSYITPELADTLANINSNLIFLGGYYFSISFLPSSYNSIEFDEFRIFNYAKTSEEIFTGFATGANINSSSLLIYHKFNTGNYALGNTSMLSTGIARDNLSYPASNSTLQNFAMDGNNSNIQMSYAMIVPKNLSTTNLSSCGFTANWEQPTNSPSKIISYQIQLSTVEDFKSILLTISGISPPSTGTLNSYSFSNLSFMTTYYFRVRGLMDDGTYSPYMVSAAIYTPELISNISDFQTIVGTTYVLNAAPAGGTWQSNNTSIVRFENSTSLLAMNKGTTTLNYSYSNNGCAQTKSITTTVDGSSEIGLDFDGNNDYASIPISNGNLSGPTNNFSIEVWFKPHAGSTGGLILGADDNPSLTGSNAILFGINSSGIPVLNLHTSASSNSYSPSGFSKSLLDNYWHYISISVNKNLNTLIFSIDGISYSSSITNLSNQFPSTNLNTFYAGYIPNSNKAPGNIKLLGIMDELRVWNYARSATEMNNACFDSIASPYTNLLLYYKFDEGVKQSNNNTVNKIIDQTGNNIGSLQNFSLSGTSSNWIKSLAMSGAKNVSISNVCGQSFRVNYSLNYPSIADDFLMDISESNTFSNFIRQGISLGNSNSIYDIGDLDLNKLYYVRIRSYATNAANGVNSSTTSASTSSCNFIWAGSINTSWNDPNNWSQPHAGFSLLPGKFDHVTIPSGISNIANINGDISVFNIYFGSTGNPKIQLSTNAEDTFNLYGQVLQSGTGLEATNGRLIGNTNANILVASSNAGEATLTFDNLTNDAQTLNSLSISRATNIKVNKLNLRNSLTLNAKLTSTNYAVNFLSTSNGTCRISYVNGTGLFSGLFQANLFIPGGRRAFRFLAHPFSVNIANSSSLLSSIFITGIGGKTNGFDSTLFNNPSAFYYTNGTGWSAWTNLNSNGSEDRWNARSGTRILIRGDRTQANSLVSNSVIPNAVTIPMFGSNFNDGQSPTLFLSRTSSDNFNFIPNPLFSNIILNSCSLTNVGNIVYLWDVNTGTRGAYKSYDLSTSTLIVPSFSSFFVTNTGSIGTNTGSIQFPESCKTSANASVNLRKNAPERILISLWQDTTTQWDQLHITLRENASMGEDAFDGVKLENPDIDLYSFSENGQKLAMDNRPTTNQIIPIGIDKIGSGKFTFKFKGSNLVTSKIAYLKDNNTFIKIDPNTKYEFNHSNKDSNIVNRFSIIIGESNQLADIGNKDQWHIAPNPNYGSFEIIGLTNDILQLKLFDLQGKLLDEPIYDGNRYINTSVQPGVYYLQVQTLKGLSTKKIIILNES